MKSNKIELRGVLLGAVLFLCCITVFAINRSGEALSVIKGSVQGCEYLGGGSAVSRPHATIKTENGNYVTAMLQNCKLGEGVNIFVTRGILYFNTVYVAEML